MEQLEKVTCIELLNSTNLANNGKKRILYIVGPNLSVGKKNCDVTINQRSDFPSDIFFVFEDSGEMVLLKSLHPDMLFRVAGKDFRGVRSIILEEGDTVEFFNEKIKICKENRQDASILFMMPKRYQTDLASQMFPPPLPREEDVPPPLPKLSEVNPVLGTADDFLQSLQKEVEMSPNTSSQTLDLEVEDLTEKKSSEKVEKKSSPPHKKTSAAMGVGPIRRIFAFLCDALFVFILLFNIPIDFFYNPFYEFVKTVVHFVQNPLVAHLDLVLGCKMILLWFFFHFWRMFGNFFWGVSFGQLAMGMRGGDTFLWNRVGGVFRESLAIFLSPLIIFDIPALFRKRTLKEVLSLTSFKSFSWPFMLLSFLTMSLLVTGGSILGPLVIPGQEVHGLNYLDKAKAQDAFKVPGASFPANFSFSTFLQLGLEKSSTNPMNGVTDELFKEFHSLPHFELVQNASKGKIFPELRLWNSEQKKSLIFRAHHRQNFFKILKQEMMELWGAKIFFPHLHKYIKESIQNETTIDAATWSEVRRILTATFLLDPEKMVENIREWGPYSSFYLRLRNHLQKSVDVKNWNESSVSLKTLGTNNFLEINSHNLSYYLPLFGSEGLVYSLSGERALKDKFWYDAETKWHFYFNSDDTMVKWSNEFSYSEMLKQPISLLQVLDLFSLPDLKEAERTQLQNFIYDWSLLRVKNILAHLPLDKGEKEFYLTYLDNIVATTQTVVKFHPEKDQFLKKMETLKLATLQEDAKILEPQQTQQGAPLESANPAEHP